MTNKYGYNAGRINPERAENLYGIRKLREEVEGKKQIKKSGRNLRQLLDDNQWSTKLIFAQTGEQI